MWHRFDLQNQISWIAIDVWFALAREFGFLSILHTLFNFDLNCALFVDQLHIRALVAHGLLHHLESARAQIPRDHLLPAVTLTGALRRFHDRLIARYLHKVSIVQLFQRYVQIHHDVGTLWGFSLFLTSAESEPEIAEEVRERIRVVHHAFLLDALLAAPIVQFAFVIVGQHLVGGSEILELLGRFGIVLVLVGMQLFGQFSGD